MIQTERLFRSNLAQLALYSSFCAQSDVWAQKLCGTRMCLRASDIYCIHGFVQLPQGALINRPRSEGWRCARDLFSTLFGVWLESAATDRWAQTLRSTSQSHSPNTDRHGDGSWLLNRESGWKQDKMSEHRQPKAVSQRTCSLKTPNFVSSLPAKVRNKGLVQLLKSPNGSDVQIQKDILWMCRCNLY